MRIVFDAYELVPGQGKSIGIYIYAKNLLKALVQQLDDDTDTEIIVLANAGNIADFSYSHKNVKVEIIGVVPGKLKRIGWLFGGAALRLKNLKADVYFSPKGFLPKALKFFSPGIKTVLVIHDLIPLWYKEHYPGQFGWLEELFINTSIVSSAKTADSVIAISQATADDIAQRLGRTSGVSVVYNGVAITQPGPRPFAQPYLFAIASTLPHKNAAGVLAAYQAYRQCSQAPLQLILCGIAEPNQEGVIAIKRLDEPSLHSYYEYAELFIFLSLAEGFGFPPVEALGHGTPVICSDIPVLQEVSKGLANYVPANEPQQVAKKIVEVLTQENTEAMKVVRKAILAEFSWSACAGGVLRVIRGF